MKIYRWLYPPPAFLEDGLLLVPGALPHWILGLMIFRSLAIPADAQDLYLPFGSIVVTPNNCPLLCAPAALQVPGSNFGMQPTTLAHAES